MKKNADYRGSFKAVGVQANIPLPSGTTLPLNASYFESTPSNPNGGSGFILGVTSGDTTGAVYGSYSDSVEVLNSASGMTIEGNNLATTFNNNAINAFFGDVVDFMFGAPNPAH